MSYDLIIRQGKTFMRALRWEAPPIIYKPITGITQAAPAVVTSPSHGIPDGWRVTVVSVKGMTQINAENDPPKAKDYIKATVPDANTVLLNIVNSSEFKPYISGGYLMFNTPVDMAGFTARMKIKDKIGGTILLDVGAYITIDNANKKVLIAIPAAITSAITWTKGVYDFEMESAGGIVTQIMSGNVSVLKEVTT